MYKLNKNHIFSRAKYGKIIAKIERNQFYDYYNSISVYEGFIAGSVRNDINSMYSKGFRCDNCLFRKNKEYSHNKSKEILEQRCCCYPHWVLLRDGYDSDYVYFFESMDFEFNSYHEHSCDSRDICEFYKFAPIYDKGIIMFPLWNKRERDEDFISELPNNFVEAIGFANMLYDMDKNNISELKKKMELKEIEYKELKKFICFFKREIPDVYKLLKKEFDKVKNDD